MSTEKELTATERFANKVNNWIAKNSKMLIIVCAAVIVLLVAIIVAFSVASNSKDKKFNALAEIETSYNSLIVMDKESDDYKSAKDGFIADAEAFVSKNSIKDYPGAKATLLIADLAFDAEDYAKANELYGKVAEAQSNTYLGQLALMNQAACAENTDDNKTALDLYNKVFNTYGQDSMFAPKALFGAARMYEATGNKDLAKATFEQLAGLYANTESGYSSEYARLAESYLMVL